MEIIVFTSFHRSVETTDRYKSGTPVHYRRLHSDIVATTQQRKVGILFEEELLRNGKCNSVIGDVPIVTEGEGTLWVSPEHLQARSDSARQQPVVGVQEHDVVSVAALQPDVARGRESLVVLPDKVHLGVVSGHLGGVIR
jgi:hypothetical protein